ncbi:hypothetical protein PENSPDRAFT_514273 [Peniophora sp. CONT]|nr:hypothetical protein PENSPDRAFT_514273 [Peniophora sp. CONT]
MVKCVDNHNHIPGRYMVSSREHQVTASAITKTTLSVMSGLPPFLLSHHQCTPMRCIHGDGARCTSLQLPPPSHALCTVNQCLFGKPHMCPKLAHEFAHDRCTPQLCVHGSPRTCLVMPQGMVAAIGSVLKYSAVRPRESVIHHAPHDGCPNAARCFVERPALTGPDYEIMDVRNFIYQLLGKPPFPLMTTREIAEAAIRVDPMRFPQLAFPRILVCAICKIALPQKLTFDTGQSEARAGE